MLRKTIAVLALILVANISQSYDPFCLSGCKANSAFTARNVYQIHNFGADAAKATEIRWHSTEPIVVMLQHGYNRVAMKRFLKVWELNELKGTKSRTLADDESFSQLELLSDAIIVGTTDGTLLFWDLWREQFLYEVPVSEGEISEVLLHPSGDWALVVIDHAKLYRFDVKSKAVAEISLKGEVLPALENVTFSSNGLLLAVADDKYIAIWDTVSWQVWGAASFTDGLIARVLFADDDTHLIVLVAATVSRWSLQAKSLHHVRKLTPYAGKRECHIRDGDISLDGSLLMTIDDCHQNRAWDLTRDEELLVPWLDFSDDDFPALAMAFSPDGRYLAVVDEVTWTVHFVHDDK